MFSTKSLTLLACAAVLSSGAVQAQPKAAAAHAQTVSAHPVASIDMGDVASAAVVSVSVVASSQPLATVAASAPAEPHLSIDDLDKITRTKLARQLAGDAGPLGVNVPAPGNPVVNPPAPVIPVKPASAHAQTEPVRFVGAFSDISGPSVLYEYCNASYPAHVGARLLNGWTVRRVDGFVITVTEGTGKATRTWTETISGGTPSQDTPQAPGNSNVRRLTDLAAPLPPGVPLSAIAQ